MGTATRENKYFENMMITNKMAHYTCIKYARISPVPLTITTLFTSLQIHHFLIKVSSISNPRPEIPENEEDASASETLTQQEKFWKRIGWTQSDSRPSAIATGAVAGIIFYVTPLVIVCIMDLPAFHRDARRMVRNITGKRAGRKKKNKIGKKKAKPVDQDERRHAWD